MDTIEPKKVRTDKTESVFLKLSELKKQKIKGKLILHLDGSGVVSRAELNIDL